MARIPNPYIVGTPIPDPSFFYGREELLSFVRDTLNPPQQRVVVLYGQRRIGKTSVLYELARQLYADYHPVYFDLMGQANRPLTHALHEIASAIGDSLDEYPKDQFDDPTDFRHYLLDVCQELSEPLLLLFDEFDDLSGEETRPDAAANTLFDYLRDLLNIQLPVVFVFVVGRRLTELPQNYQSILKQAPSRRVGFLSEQNAKTLITKPAEGQLEFTESAIQAVYDLTSGHPYFTQLICFELFRLAQNHNQMSVTQADVYNILDQALETGKGGLAWYWDALPLAERFVMSALAEITSGTEGASTEQVSELLQSYDLRLLGMEISEAPYTLTQWEILRKTAVGYRFSVELVRRWVVAEHPLIQAKQELNNLNPRAKRYFENARDYHQEGKLPEAIDDYKRAIEANPYHSQAHMGYAQALEEMGDFLAANQAYQEAYKLDKEAARDNLLRSYEKLANEAEQEKQLPEAISYLESANEVLTTSQREQRLATLNKRYELQQAEKAQRFRLARNISVAVVAVVAFLIFFPIGLNLLNITTTEPIETLVANGTATATTSSYVFVVQDGCTGTNIANATLTLEADTSSPVSAQTDTNGIAVLQTNITLTATNGVSIQAENYETRTIFFNEEVAKGSSTTLSVFSSELSTISQASPTILTNELGDENSVAIQNFVRLFANNRQLSEVELVTCNAPFVADDATALELAKVVGVEGVMYLNLADASNIGLMLTLYRETPDQSVTLPLMEDVVVSDLADMSTLIETIDLDDNITKRAVEIMLNSEMPALLEALHTNTDHVDFLLGQTTLLTLEILENPSLVDSLTEDGTLLQQVDKWMETAVENQTFTSPILINTQLGYEMTYVPQGTFIQGRDALEAAELCASYTDLCGNNSQVSQIVQTDFSVLAPPHDVWTSAYFAGTQEVSNEAYQACVEAGICTEPQTEFTLQQLRIEPNFPVAGITQAQADTFCAWAVNGRLPTEAEWEKLARWNPIAGQTQIYPWGDATPSFNDKHGNYYISTELGTYMDVGQFPEGVSPLGAYDIVGNVREWTADWYSATYYQSLASRGLIENPTGPPNGTTVVLKGASFDDFILDPAYREELPPDLFDGRVGFRCVSENPFQDVTHMEENNG